MMMLMSYMYKKTFDEQQGFSHELETFPVEDEESSSGDQAREQVQHNRQSTVIGRYRVQQKV